MMTAKINFITNNLLVDMTCRENELRSSLPEHRNTYCAEYDIPR